MRPINYWYLFDNAKFYNRIAVIGECRKCNQVVILLSEQRKEDDKIFNDLRVGKKAEELIARCSEWIDYTYDDIKHEQVPFGWKYGKAVRLKDGYRILRSDFKGNTELIGYIHKTGSKIISEEEYERINK